MTPPLSLETLETLLDRATPGPWEHGDAMCCPDLGWVCGVIKSVYSGAGKFTHSMRIEDAEAIAVLRNAAPALIAELRAARALIETIRFTSVGWVNTNTSASLVRDALDAYDAATKGATPAPGKEP